MALTTVDGTRAEGGFSWLDAASVRHSTTARVHLDVDLSKATQLEWGDTRNVVEACPTTLNFSATLELQTNDGAFNELLTGSISSADGLIQFTAAASAAELRGSISPPTTGTVHVMAVWSVDGGGVAGREAQLQLRKLELTDAAGNVELATLAETVATSKDTAPAQPSSVRGCTKESSRRTVTSADGGTSAVLAAIHGYRSDARFGWLDAAGSRQFTTAHVSIELSLSTGTQIEWVTPESGSTACATTLEYPATLVLETDDGAFSERVTGTLSSSEGLHQFTASKAAANFAGSFSRQTADTISILAVWSGEDLGVAGRKPVVSLRKLELTDAAGDIEFAALAP